MPVPPAGASGIQGTVEVFPEYREGLKELKGFSHVILLYHFHLSQGFEIHDMPRLVWLTAKRAAIYGQRDYR